MQHVTPVHFFETVNIYQRTEALKGAIELELFTHIAAGKKSVSAIAKAIKAPERATRILCDYLTITGFITKKGTAYSLTPDTAMFLDKKSPAYLGSAINFLLAPHLTENFNDVAALVRNGGTLQKEGGTIAPENPIWVKFAQAMMPIMAEPAQQMAQLVNGTSKAPLRILDIAAGHGIFGISFARLNPNAEIVAQDWPNVLEVAKENAQRFGVTNRYQTLAGSAFDVEYGEEYDLVLLTNFLHHFDTTTCVRLLKKVYKSLKKGGKAVTLEFIPNDDRVTPPGSAGFAFMMLGTTPSGDAYTFAELKKMCVAAGFKKNVLNPLPNSMQHVVISTK